MRSGLRALLALFLFPTALFLSSFSYILSLISKWIYSPSSGVNNSNGSLSETNRVLSQTHRHKTANSIPHRVYRCDTTGAVSNLYLSYEYLDPPPPGWIQVKVHAIGLNFADIFAIQGLYSATPQGSFIPGLEYSGEIIAVNYTSEQQQYIQKLSKYNNIHKNKNNTAHTTNPNTTANTTNITTHTPIDYPVPPSTMSPIFHVGDRVCGVTRFGGYSTILNADAMFTKHLPPDWTYAQGASLLVQSLTAAFGLFHHGGLTIPRYIYESQMNKRRNEREYARYIHNHQNNNNNQQYISYDHHNNNNDNDTTDDNHSHESNNTQISSSSSISLPIQSPGDGGDTTTDTTTTTVATAPVIRHRQRINNHKASSHIDHDHQKQSSSSSSSKSTSKSTSQHRSTTNNSSQPRTTSLTTIQNDDDRHNNNTNKKDKNTLSSQSQTSSHNNSPILRYINDTGIVTPKIVLVHSAAGGVGLHALQMITKIGCIPICTVSGSSKREYLVRRFGLRGEQVIDRSRLGRLQVLHVTNPHNKPITRYKSIKRILLLMCYKLSRPIRYVLERTILSRYKLSKDYALLLDYALHVLHKHKDIYYNTINYPSSTTTTAGGGGGGASTGKQQQHSTNPNNYSTTSTPLRPSHTHRKQNTNNAQQQQQHGLVYTSYSNIPRLQRSSSGSILSVDKDIDPETAPHHHHSQQQQSHQNYPQQQNQRNQNKGGQQQQQQQQTSLANNNKSTTSGSSGPSSSSSATATIDLVLDSLLGPFFDPTLARMSQNGRVVVFGAATFATRTNHPDFVHIGYQYLRRPRLDPMDLIPRNLLISGFNLIWLWDHVSELRVLLDLVDCLIDEPINISQLPPPSSSSSSSTTLLDTSNIHDISNNNNTDQFMSMHSYLAYLQSGQSIGKVVINVQHSQEEIDAIDMLLKRNNSK